MRSTPKDIQQIVAEMQPGTLSAEVFANRHYVVSSIILRHIINGLKRANGERIEATEIPRKGRIWRFLTPEQQQKALTYWDKYHVRYDLPPKESNVYM